MATIYQDPSGVGRPYPNGGFNVPLENANAPEALQARQRAMDRATLRAGPSAAPTAPTAAAAEATGAKSTGWFKRAGDALRNPGKTLATATPTARGVGKFAGATARVLGPAAAGADVVSHLNDFKIDDPTNDSSLSGTFNALRKGDFSGAGRSLSKGALEAGMDLGSAAANVADIFVPGKAPVSTAYNSMLREKFGDQLVDRTGTAPAALAPQPQPAAAKVNPHYGNEHLRAPSAPATTPEAAPVNPNGVITRGPGNSYSGTANAKAGADMVDPQGAALDAATGVKSGARAGYGVSTIDGIGVEGHLRQLANIRALGGPGAGEPINTGAAGFGGATLSSALREKVEREKTPSMNGLSAQQAVAAQQGQRQLAQGFDIAQMQNATAQAGQANQLRTAEMNNATLRENNANTARVNMRGHELDFQGRMAPIEVARQQRLRAATYMQGGGAAEGGAGGAGGRYAAAAQAAAANGDDALAQHFATLASGEQTRGAAADAQQTARAAGTEKLFKPFFTKDVTGKDGTVSQQFDEVGAAKAAATVRGMYGEKFDKLSDDQKRSAILEVVAQQRNADAEAQVMPGFMDRAKDLFGMYDAPAPIQGGRRDIRGGKPEKAGLISPPGVSRHDTLLRLPNGQTVNYGVVTDQQIADINERSRLR